MSQRYFIQAYFLLFHTYALLSHLENPRIRNRSMSTCPHYSCPFKTIFKKCLKQVPLFTMQILNLAVTVPQSYSLSS